jgi:hypothetical protein
MTDLYRDLEQLDAAARPAAAHPAAPAPGPPPARPAAPDNVRRALWLLLVVLGSANAVLSLTTLPVVVGLLPGLGALACVWALVVRHRRGTA